jgi:hypothetical protein
MGRPDRLLAPGAWYAGFTGKALGFGKANQMICWHLSGLSHGPT